MCVLVWKVYLNKQGDNIVVQDKPALNFVVAGNGIEKMAAWWPRFDDNDWEIRGQLISQHVDVYMAYFAGQSDHAELIAFKNRIYRPNFWSFSDKGEMTIQLNNSSVLSASLFDLRNANGQHRLLCYWYLLGGDEYSNNKVAKIQQAINELIGGSPSGSVIAFSKTYNVGDKSMAVKALRDTIIEHYPQIKAAVDVP